MGTDSTYSTSMLAGGTGQTWDYTGLINLATDTLGFGDAAGTPYVSSFPNSTLSGHKPWNTDYSYFHGNSNGFYVDGIANPTTVFAYNSPSLYFPIPFSYGSTRLNYAYIQIDTVYLTYNARVRISLFENFEADGTGTIQLPGNTFNNVLRVKETVLTYDSISVDLFGTGSYMPFSSGASQVVNYLYMAPGHDPVYVLGIQADSLGTTTTSSTYFIASYNGIANTPSVKPMSVFPNPAAANLNFDLSDLSNASSIRIFNANGKLVRSYDANTANAPVSVSDLPNGTYHFEVASGNRTYGGSFVVQH